MKVGIVWLASLALAAASLVLGCGSPLQPALDAFEAGRLPDAAREFRALEPDFVHLSAHDQARYALFRGLTELSLGDARRADAWLGPLKAALDAEPRTLSAAERGALLAAWRSMGRMPGPASANASP
jgi:hypothetical protein